MTHSASHHELLQRLATEALMLREGNLAPLGNMVTLLDAMPEATDTAALADVRDLVPGDLSLAVHPDPYPGHLRRRTGIDIEALDDVVDEFVVPLYDTAYGTTYWLEALASGFADRVEGRFAVELYAVDVDVDALVRATRVAETDADAVYFGYDASTARAGTQPST